MPDPTIPAIPTTLAALSSPDRRRLLRLLGGSALALALGPVAAAGPARQAVQVVTSYPDEVVSRVEAAFEKAYPAYRLQVVWRMPHDALPYLQQAGQGGADVYWSASPRNFAALKAAGAWRRLDIDRSGLPANIGKTAISDADGYYLASEVAGYGYAINPAELARLGVPPPADWRDLTDPRYAGKIALPNPARVGFAPVMVEIVLQAYGWQAGWALWSEIAGNATLVERGATFVSDEVGSGRSAVGLSIDFFVASAVANGAPLRFVYPRHSGINPGQIAVTAAAPNAAGAQAFAEFVLSEAGQRLLTHADIRKLPARPAAYAGLPGDYHDPFRAAAAGVYDFDGPAAQPRLALSAALFEQMLVREHAALCALWRRIHAGEAAGKAVAGARQRLAAPLLSEAEAADDSLRRRFRARVEGSEAAPSADENGWWRAEQARRSEVVRLLKEVGA